MEDVAVDMINTNFILANTSNVLANTPIDYLKDVELAGSLFRDDCTNGAISCVYTHFFVDHREPLAALDVFKAKRRWCLGELPEGHEFLILLPVE
jgi:hypothetical protein